MNYADDIRERIMLLVAGAANDATKAAVLAPMHGRREMVSLARYSFRRAAELYEIATERHER
jgi:hypothetical protein